MANYDSFRPIQFLRWFCRPEYLDEIEGDIIELYEWRLNNSPTKAGRMLWWDVFRSFHWVNLKKVNIQKNTPTMFNNYFKVGLRNLRRDYRFTLINLLGLSLGMSIFLMMLMMIRHEFSFDEFHTKSHRIYQVIQEFRQSDGVDPEIWTPLPLAEALETELSTVVNGISLQGAASNWVTADDKRFFEEDGIIADDKFFDIFDFELAEGDPNSALQHKRSVVISEALSRKYFGFENPIGKILEYEFYGRFTVTAVMKEVPANSYLQFDYILTRDLDTYFQNTASWYEGWFLSWRGHGVSTFAVLEEDTNPDIVEDQISKIVRKNLPDEEVNTFRLLNMTDLHFGSNGIDGRINQHIKGDLEKVRLFSLISTIVLLMACFNYVNITLARSIKRHKEVGVRKSIGARRRQLMALFLVESFVLVLLSLIISLTVSYFLIPLFNELVGLNLVFSWSLAKDNAPWMLLSVLGITLLSGYYPAVILSRLSPTLLVARIGQRGNSTHHLRNGLVTMQFAVVIVIATILVVINDQFRYLSNKNLGLETEEILVVEINSGGVRNNYQTLKNELLTHPAIQQVTGITRVFSGYRSPVPIRGHLTEAPQNQVPMKFYGVDQEALDVFGLKLLAGKGFTGLKSVDSTSVILNASAAERLGGEGLLGQWIELEEDHQAHAAKLKARVIGIVDDFHFESLHQSVKPMAIGHYRSPFESLDDIIIKIDGIRIQKAMEHIEKVHHVYDTNDIMTWEFLDQMAQRAYEEEVIFRNVMTAAAFTSLFISLLGMIGMISYSIISLSKEFGIRKVMGASFRQLMILNSKVFIRYIAVAAVMGIPTAWWISYSWLSTYAFRIPLTPIPFTMIILIMTALTGITIFFLGKNTFRQNPTKALRYE